MVKTRRGREKGRGRGRVGRERFLFHQFQPLTVTTLFIFYIFHYSLFVLALVCVLNLSLKYFPIIKIQILFHLNSYLKSLGPGSLLSQSNVPWATIKSVNQTASTHHILMATFYTLITVFTLELISLCSSCFTSILYSQLPIKFVALISDHHV